MLNTQYLTSAFIDTWKLCTIIFIYVVLILESSRILLKTMLYDKPQRAQVSNAYSNVSYLLLVLPLLSLSIVLSGLTLNVLFLIDKEFPALTSGLSYIVLFLTKIFKELPLPSFLFPTPDVQLELLSIFALGLNTVLTSITNIPLKAFYKKEEEKYLTDLEKKVTIVTPPVMKKSKFIKYY